MCINLAGVDGRSNSKLECISWELMRNDAKLVGGRSFVAIELRLRLDEGKARGGISEISLLGARTVRSEM